MLWSVSKKLFQTFVNEVWEFACSPALFVATCVLLMCAFVYVTFYTATYYAVLGIHFALEKCFGA